MADKISTENKKGYETYLKKRVLTQFSFNLVDENAVSRYLASLKTKNSTGHDGISVKLLKFLAPGLVKPLTRIINQSSVTGVFPDK